MGRHLLDPGKPLPIDGPTIVEKRFSAKQDDEADDIEIAEREKHREQSAKWREANREKHRTYAREYYRAKYGKRKKPTNG